LNLGKKLKCFDKDFEEDPQILSEQFADYFKYASMKKFR
jgi:hypothetical protein